MRSTNSTLDGILEKKIYKKVLQDLQRIQIIHTADLEKISTYLYENLTPAALRFRV